MTEKRPLALSFGECLWDSLPEGLFPGGAPLNVAYHLTRHGVEAHLVSAVGGDPPGDELLRRLRGWGMPADMVARLPGLPTGSVRASLDQAGNAAFRIATGVAWDSIPAGEAALSIAKRADALIFGSLALRSEHNRGSLGELLDLLPANALTGFDVNLRPPFDDLSRVRSFAGRASVIKLNSAEAARIAGDGSGKSSDDEGRARRLSDEFGAAVICVTGGPRGAGLLREGRWTWESARPVKVADTIGAGDAFLASLVAGLLSGKGSDQEILARACRIGEWVASQSGATPDYARGAPV